MKAFNEITAHAYTSDAGEPAFTVFETPDGDCAVLTTDGTVADGMVTGNPGQYVHLHVVCSPDVATRLLRGEITYDS